jgi:opacity protein-like surface antigen
MNRFFTTVAIVLAAGVPAVTHAQTTPASPVTLVLMGGAAMPMGDLDDISDMGFTLGAGAEFGMSVLPFGLRAELGYTRFGAWEVSSTEGSISMRPSNLAVTLNAVMGPTVPASQIRPYFIAGVGFYNSKIDAEIDSPDFVLSGNESKGGFGLNGGAGLRFQFVGFSSFIEARYHHVFNGMIDLESEDEENVKWTSAGYLPIVFGFTIGG